MTVRSTSRPFHVMAAQVIAALGGLEAVVIEEAFGDEGGAEAGEGAGGAGTTTFRRIGRSGAAAPVGRSAADRAR